jgi:hypothetical protein
VEDGYLVEDQECDSGAGGGLLVGGERMGIGVWAIGCLLEDLTLRKGILKEVTVYQCPRFSSSLMRFELLVRFMLFLV